MSIKIVVASTLQHIAMYPNVYRIAVYKKVLPFSKVNAYTSYVGCVYTWDGMSHLKMSSLCLGLQADSWLRLSDKYA